MRRVFRIKLAGRRGLGPLPVDSQRLPVDRLSMHLSGGRSFVSKDWQTNAAGKNGKGRIEATGLKSGGEQDGSGFYSCRYESG